MENRKFVHQFVVRVTSFSAICLLISACGSDEKSNADKAMDAYLYGTFKSECTVIPERERWSRDGMSLGQSFVEIHQVHFSETYHPTFREGQKLGGSIERVLYHDSNCGLPAATIRIKSILSEYKATEKGISFGIHPWGFLVVHDEAACRFFTEAYRWDQNAGTQLDTACVVGKEYDLSNNFYFKSVEREDVPTIHQLAYEVQITDSVSSADGKLSSELIILGPSRYFTLIAGFRSGTEQSIPMRPGYKVTLQGARLEKVGIMSEKVFKR